MISPRSAQLVSMFTFIVSIAEGDKNCNQSVNQCCDGLSSCLIFLRFFAHCASQKTLDISKFLFSHAKRKKHCQCVLIEKTQSKVDGITFLFDCDCFLCLLTQQSQSHIFDFFSTSLHKVSLRGDTPAFSDCRGGRLFQAPR